MSIFILLLDGELSDRSEWPDTRRGVAEAASTWKQFYEHGIKGFLY